MKSPRVILSNIYRHFSNCGKSITRPRPNLEFLEDRSVPTVSPTLSNNLLSINVVNDNDKLTAFLRLEGPNIEVADNTNFTGANSFAASLVNQIAVLGGKARNR